MMLTEIDGKWIDLSEVAQIVDTGEQCFIHLKGDRDSIDMNMPARELAELVNQVKANRFVEHLSIPEKRDPETAAAAARFVEGMRTGRIPPLEVVPVNPDAKAFLTPKGMDAISNRARLAALQDVASMMESFDQQPLTGPWRELEDWLKASIDAVGEHEERCPSGIRMHLAGIQDQCGKTQYWNALGRIDKLSADVRKLLRQVMLKAIDEARASEQNSR